MKINQKTLRRLFFSFLLLTLSFGFTSCNNSGDSPVEPNPQVRGGIISFELKGTAESDFIQRSIDSFHVNIEIIYDVDVYTITYYTEDTKGDLTIASGALFVPKGKDNLPLMSLHHGTQTNRSKAGSVNPQLYSPEGFIGGGLGYFTLVPDYLGLGASNLLHPYLHAKSSADAVIDFIRACRTIASKINVKLNGQVFLAGYSEGGYVTLAAHREIQQKYSSEINVTASSPMAGPYDLYLTSQAILKNTNYGKPSYMAYLAMTYNSIYGWNNLKGIFNSPYADVIPSLFDGTKNIDDVDAQLTSDLTKLFTKDFLDSFLAGTETQFSAALRENSLINWVPIAPVRFYHGSADQFVPYENSTKAREYFISNGANVELVTIEGGNHNTALMPSILGAIDWFNGIRLEKVLAYK